MLTELKGEIHYIDQYNRDWAVKKKGSLYIATNGTDRVNDYHIHQLFQQIDKRPAPDK